MNCDSWQLKTMKPTNNNQQLSIEKTELFLKLDSRIVEFEIKNNVFGYRYTKHINDFLKPIEEEPKAFLKLFSIDPEKIEFRVTQKEDKRIFFGYLQPGIPAKLGINFKFVITEHFHNDTKTFSYSLDANISKKEERQISDFARNLFDLPDKPNNVKPRKNLKGKK